MPPNNTTPVILIFILGLALPVILLPILSGASCAGDSFCLGGYPEVIEEITKALVVVFVVMRLKKHSHQILAAGLFGLVFGLSENFLYLNNILNLGISSIFWKRMLFTVPLHTLTPIIMTLARIAGRFAFLLGLLGAIFIHALFNMLALGVY